MRSGIIKNESLPVRLPALAESVADELLLEFVEELQVAQHEFVQLHLPTCPIAVLGEEGPRAFFLSVAAVAFQHVQLGSEGLFGKQFAVLAIAPPDGRQFGTAAIFSEGLEVAALAEVKSHVIQIAFALRSFQLLANKNTLLRLRHFFHGCLSLDQALRVQSLRNMLLDGNRLALLPS